MLTKCTCRARTPSVEQNIKFAPATVTITMYPPIPPSLILMPSTATTTQLSMLMTQQAAATLPTPPISTITVTVPSSPSSISSSIPLSLISAPQTPPPATDSGEEELPEVEDMLATPSTKTVSTPAQPVSPPPACRSTWIAQKQAQSSTTSSPTTYASNTARSLQRQNTRSSGGAGPGLSKWFHPNWKDPEASH